MRSLGLSASWVMAALLIVACGDNIVPPAGTDENPVGNDDTPVDTDIPMDTPLGTPPSDPGHGTPRAITAALDINSPSCEAATASFEVLADHADDRTFVKNPRCHVTFDDGAVSDLCAGEHTFATPGAHTFTVDVVDLDTGATAHAEVTRVIAVPLAVELAVDVPECGLEVAFKATLSTRADVHVTMSPADKVVEPNVVGTSGSFLALEAGTYTIQLLAEDERATGPICVREVAQTITLTACCPQ
jgi:hypothetical protein